MSKTATKKTAQTATKKTTAPATAVTDNTAPAPTVAPAPVATVPAVVEAAPKKQKAKDVKEQEVEQTEDGKRKRFFKCVYEGKVHGRYSGEKPKQAANKAFTNIIRSMKGDVVGKKVKFQMKECTRGSNQKTSTYEGERVKLDTPLKIEIKKNTDKPKVIEYKFTNKINKVKDAEQTGGEKKQVAKKAPKTNKTAKSKTAKKPQKGGAKKQAKATKQTKAKKVEAKVEEPAKVEVAKN